MPTCIRPPWKKGRFEEDKQRDNRNFFSGRGAQQQPSDDSRTYKQCLAAIVGSLESPCQLHRMPAKHTVVQCTMPQAEKSKVCRDRGLCFKCQSDEHFARNCPLSAAEAQQVSAKNAPTQKGKQKFAGKKARQH